MYGEVGSNLCAAFSVMLDLLITIRKLFWLLIAYGVGGLTSLCAGEIGMLA
jgi:hypothetical protein